MARRLGLAAGEASFAIVGPAHLRIVDSRPTAAWAE